MFAQWDFYGNNPAAVGLRTQREVRPKSEWDLLQASITRRCCLFGSSALWTDCVSPWRAHLIHLLVSCSRHVVVYFNMLVAKANAEPVLSAGGPPPRCWTPGTTSAAPDLHDRATLGRVFTLSF